MKDSIITLFFSLDCAIATSSQHTGQSWVARRPDTTRHYHYIFQNKQSETFKAPADHFEASWDHNDSLIEAASHESKTIQQWDNPQVVAKLDTHQNLKHPYPNDTNSTQKSKGKQLEKRTICKLDKSIGFFNGCCVPWLTDFLRFFKTGWCQGATTF